MKKYKTHSLLSDLIWVVDARNRTQALRRGRRYFKTSMVNIIQQIARCLLKMHNTNQMITYKRVEFNAFSTQYINQ